MFRRTAQGLPKDPVFPTTFKELGYFINKDDQIRRIDNPDQGYFHGYRATNNNRYNDLYQEALHTCIRREVISRMTSLGVPLFAGLSFEEDEDEDETPTPVRAPCTPIFATPPQELAQKSRIFVIVNSSEADLGVWDYRTIFKDGINAGSCISLVKDIFARITPTTEDKIQPGIIVLNPGQTLWTYHHDHALTRKSWDRMPRPSAVHPAPSIAYENSHLWTCDEKAAIKHVRHWLNYLFEECTLIDNNDGVFLISVGDGASLIRSCLDQPFEEKSPASSFVALACVNPPLLYMTSNRLAVRGKLPGGWALTMYGQYGRSWVSNARTLGAPVANAHYVEASKQYTGKNIYNFPHLKYIQPGEVLHLTPAVSSGPDIYGDEMMSKVYKSVVDWLLEVSAALDTDDHYIWPVPFDIEDSEDGEDEAVEDGWSDGEEKDKDVDGNGKENKNKNEKNDDQDEEMTDLNEFDNNDAVPYKKHIERTLARRMAKIAIADATMKD